MSNTPVVHQISECVIKPKTEVKDSNHPYYLAPLDLIMLSVHYIQKGLLFKKPSTKFTIDTFLDELKDSLARTLVHFYPLAGQLVTEVDQDHGSRLVYVDCNKGPGARFICARLDMNMSDILSPVDVPLVVQSLFDHDRAVNHDGHTRPLLSVQITELVDGIFIGCSINHALADGTSYWHFWNVWSEIHRAQGEHISVTHPPIHKRWVPDGYGPILKLPFGSTDDEFISRFEAPELRERVFHFSSGSMAKLKERANTESCTNKISSFQALSALVWRSIIRAQGLLRDQKTNGMLACNNRQRLDPPLSQDYFGNCIQALKTTTTAGELLDQNLGWAAMKLHQSVSEQNDRAIRDYVHKWLKSPFVYHHGVLFDNGVMMGSSPRFDMYGNEFGLGKAVAVRSGYPNKFAGKVTAYPGREGGGSVDLEICLPPDAMSALELDEEFMASVSS